MLQYQSLPKLPWQLCGVTGHFTELRGLINVLIEIVRQKKVMLPVYMAEIFLRSKLLGIYGVSTGLLLHEALGERKINPCQGDKVD